MEKGSAAEVPMADQEKQGGKCCGGCCDYRRAVIVLCIVSLVFAVLGIVNPALNQAFDSTVYPELDEIIKDHATATLAIGVVHIIVTILCMVGAIIFNFWLVALYVLWAILYLILTIVFEQQLVNDLLDWIEKEAAGDPTYTAQTQDELETAFNTYAIISYVLTALFTLLWVYPSVFLSVEIKKGIMTKETYPREEMSCCCVAHRN